MKKIDETFLIEEDKLSHIISDMLKEGYFVISGGENRLFFRPLEDKATEKIDMPGMLKMNYGDGPHGVVISYDCEGTETLYKVARCYFDVRNLADFRD